MDLEAFTLDELVELLRVTHEGAKRKPIVQEIIRKQGAREQLRIARESRVAQGEVPDKTESSEGDVEMERRKERPEERREKRRKKEKEDRNSRLTVLGIVLFLIVACFAIAWALSYSSGDRGSTSSGAAPKAACSDGIARVEILGGSVSLWATSDSEDGIPKLADIPNGTIVRTLGVCRDRYSKVIALGQEGWIQSITLKATD